MAGPATELEPLLAALKSEGVFVRKLDTQSVAYHSPALGALGAELQAGAPWPRSKVDNVWQ